MLTRMVILLSLSQNTSFLQLFFVSHQCHIYVIAKFNSQINLERGKQGYTVSNGRCQWFKTQQLFLNKSV